MNPIFKHQKQSLIHFLEKQYFPVDSFEGEEFLLIFLHTTKKIALQIDKNLTAHGKKVHLLEAPDGEESKNWSFCELILKRFDEMKGDKKTTLIACGGGACCDAVAFTASILFRGIRLILIPTTLLSMVDAAIGGKTAINTALGKNTVGSFYPANHVIIWLSILNDLNHSLINEGFSEIVKTALIFDKSLFLLLYDYPDKWDAKCPDFMKKVIERCIEIKLEITQEDFIDASKRNILNFGHTFGHAFEAFFNFSISHGKCVAWGLLLEAYLSVKMKLLKIDEFSRIVRFLKKYHLLSPLPEILNDAKILAFLQKDKKNENKQIHCVLINSIGNVAKNHEKYVHSISSSLAKEAIEWLNYTFLIHNHEILSCKK